MEESVGTVNNTRSLEGEKFYGDPSLSTGDLESKTP